MKAGTASLRLAAALFLLGLLSACTPPTALRQHPDFDARCKQIGRVAVLPPAVSVERVMFSGGNETMEDKQDAYPASLTTSAIGALHRLGYATSKVNLIERSAADPDLAFQIEQVKNAYTAAAKPLNEGTVNEDDYKRFRVSLGPVVNPVGDAAAADALLLVQFEGMTKSDGQMKKEIAANVLLAALTGAYAQPIRSASIVHVALIDAVSGDVLWVNTEGKVGLSTSIISDALNKLPEGGMQDVIAAEDAAEQAAQQAAREQRDKDAEAAGIDPASLPASWQ
jgi:hypothetical protein